MLTLLLSVLLRVCSPCLRDSAVRTTNRGEDNLPLTLTLHLVPDLLLRRPARHACRSLRLRRRFLPRHALDFLSFGFVREILRVHQSLFNPAYFSTSFLSPKRGKFTVILASSPS